MGTYEVNDHLIDKVPPLHLFKALQEQPFCFSELRGSWSYIKNNRESPLRYEGYFSLQKGGTGTLTMRVGRELSLANLAITLASYAMGPHPSQAVDREKEGRPVWERLATRIEHHVYEGTCRELLPLELSLDATIQGIPSKVFIAAQRPTGIRAIW
ncbi:hypothetical protein HY488_00245 [Candidatus Woesearchaeota archaeon]|nr:hypothetical protein [Candidatus Woesearchaeota archaeon]